MVHPCGLRVLLSSCVPSQDMTDVSMLVDEGWSLARLAEGTPHAVIMIPGGRLSMWLAA